jgi:hypothetical protein
MPPLTRPPGETGITQMRCVQCNRDYTEPQAFCHQCGEALLPTASTAATAIPTLVEERSRARVVGPSSQLRARAISRHRAPRRSQSLLFASVVVLGAFAGLALVWRQAWMPSFPRTTLSLSREAGQPPPPANNPPAQVTADPAAPPASAPVAPTVSATPEPEPASLTPNSAPTPAPAPVTTRAPETAAAAPARRRRSGTRSRRRPKSRAARGRRPRRRRLPAARRRLPRQPWIVRRRRDCSARAPIRERRFPRPARA